MGWLTLTEYSGRHLGSGQMQFDCASPLVEQRLLIDDQPTRSRAFSIQSTLIHVRADCACLLELENPFVSVDLAANAEQYFAVISGGSLTVIRDTLAPEMTDNTSEELS